MFLSIQFTTIILIGFIFIRFQSITITSATTAIILSSTTLTFSINIIISLSLLVSNLISSFYFIVMLFISSISIYSSFYDYLWLIFEFSLLVVSCFYRFLSIILLFKDIMSYFSNIFDYNQVSFFFWIINRYLLVLNIILSILSFFMNIPCVFILLIRILLKLSNRKYIK